MKKDKNEVTNETVVEETVKEKKVKEKKPGSGKIKKFFGFFWKHKLITIIIILAIVGASVYGIQKKKMAEANAYTAPETETLTKQDITTTVSASGKIVCNESKDVVGQLSGQKILTMNFKVGDTINEGDVICTLDTADIEYDLEVAETNLEIDKAKDANSLDNSGRSLYNTQITAVNDTNRNIEAVDDAKKEYDTLVGEKNEANRKYEDAKKIYDDYYSESTYNDLLAQKEKKLKQQSELINKEISTKEELKQKFNSELTELGGYLQTNKASDFEKANIEDIDSIADAKLVNGSVDDTARGYINKLEILHADYVGAKSSDYDSVTAELKEIEAKLSYMSAAKTAMESAKSSVDSAQNKVNSADSNYTSAQRKLEDTYRTDVNNVADSQNAYENAQLSSSVVGQSYEKQIRQYEEQIENATVYAPMSGIVTSVKYHAGDKYNGDVLLTIEDASKYKIEANIDEYDISDIVPGQKVTFKTNATGTDELEGIVATIAPRATTTTSASSTSTSSTASYKVTIDILSKNDRLRLDMAAKIYIVTNEVDNTFAVPEAAIHTDEETGDSYIVVQEGNALDMGAADLLDADAATIAVDASKSNKKKSLFAKAEPVEEIPTRNITVKTGLTNDYYTVIESPELKEGMIVVTSSDDTAVDLNTMMGMMGPMGGM